MSVPYRLHYAPDNASLIVRMVLDALQQPYDTALVDRAAQGQAAPQYLALNPNGLIPTLETPVGPIFETGAIVLWLADRHSALAPALDDPGRGDFLKWLFFVSNTVHTSLRMLFYPGKYAGPERAAQLALSQQTVTALKQHLTILNDAAGAGHSWLVGVSPSVLDFYIAACLRWLVLYPRTKIGGTIDVRPYTHLMTLAKRVEQHPAARTARAVEGLGPTPFSAPVYAQPPEGSAT
jgi:glutathione S-transferase